MSVERALADVTVWTIGGIIEVRGRGKYRVIAAGAPDPAKTGSLVDHRDGTFTYYAAGGAYTLMDLQARGGGRQSRLSAEIFNQSEEVAEKKIKKSSADGAPPDGVVAI